MIDKDRIKAEADAFFEWPSKDKMYVTTTSMLIFTNVIAEMARTEEREACARVCEAHAEGWEKNPGNNPSAGFIAASNCACDIRTRSNAEVSGRASDPTRTPC